ncbi:dicarboxylate/amino acid:cation symporter [Candidatus Phycosocius spiralis]|uniref:Dicarboxylate:amino acid:cation symporter DAACS family protein n=1 Tax=Candidatus Phycosocius spiralis TaxID=2815099 RepID=A0ABQ4PVV2_9PROT|nr:cation:dicarboxylase symporter family transporter [Candidatus Phycosocius spiralis]GIU67070.1 dicarboxylate:amino acid:cation symporter DAACS family protein [Candidatus Phycosocius spiralis]
MTKALFILAALILGLLAGIGFGQIEAIKSGADTIGSVWLNALRMTVVPLVVALLITGIAQTALAARAGRLAARGVGTMLAILWGSSILAAVMIPLILGVFPMPDGSADALRAALSITEKPGPVPPLGDFLRAMIPTNPIAAAANDAILPLIIFTAAFAFALTRLPLEKRVPVTGFFEAVAEAMVLMIGWVLALAPIGVFSLAFVVGAKAGAEAFGALAHYVIVLSALGLIVWALSFVMAVVGARQGLGTFFKAAIPAQAVAISTQSSLASLPAMLKGVQALGVPAAKADLILPIAVAIFRATGPAMNVGVALYIAAWFGIELGPAQMALGIAAGAITTLGAVSLPGSISFISSIAPICLALGAPIEPLALLVAVETVPDIFRTLGNVTMDMAVTATVARQDDDAAGQRA